MHCSAVKRILQNMHKRSYRWQCKLVVSSKKEVLLQNVHI
jgi:hypothetical protein